MLVDIRAWDTMGEISVLVVVATGVASLLFVTGRNGRRARGCVESRERRKGREPQARARRPASAHAARSAGCSRQHAGCSPAAPSPRPTARILLEVLVRLLFHPAIIVSVYLLFVGHNAPGGGFAGGLLAGLALVARYLAGGRYELGEAVPDRRGQAARRRASLLAVGTALGSLFFGGEMLDSAYFEARCFRARAPVVRHVDASSTSACTSSSSAWCSTSCAASAARSTVSRSEAERRRASPETSSRRVRPRDERLADPRRADGRHVRRRRLRDARAQPHPRAHRLPARRQRDEPAHPAS